MRLATWAAAGVLLATCLVGRITSRAAPACADTIVNGYLIRLAVPLSGTVCQR